MAKAPKGEASKAAARELRERLLRLKPDHMSANEWLKTAGVSTGLLANMAAKGSMPSVANLEALLKVAGYSMAEFYMMADMTDRTRAQLIDLLRKLDPDTVDAMLRLVEKALAQRAA